MPRHLRDRLDLPIDASRAERALWFHLRDRRMARLRFRRRQHFSGFVADFYCHEARLIILLTGRCGGREDEQVILDADLTIRGFEVLRFSNAQVREDLSAVLTRIESTATRRAGVARNEPETLASLSAKEWRRGVRWGSKG
jgi:very-short-patch-repair endonuclease